MYKVNPITVVTGLNKNNIVKFIKTLRKQINGEATAINKSIFKQQFSKITDSSTFSLVVQYLAIYKKENAYYWFLLFPETNLHPHHQRNIARVLVSLINNYNVYVVIGTNSDFIVNELNLCYYDTRDKHFSPYEKYPLTNDQICGYEVNRKDVALCNFSEWCGLIIESFDREIRHQNEIENDILWGSQRQS